MAPAMVALASVDLCIIMGCSHEDSERLPIARMRRVRWWRRTGVRVHHAFQPIVNVTTKEIFAHEALVRGGGQETAAQVFEKVNDTNRYRFDQSCRVKAVKFAAELAMPSFLSINFMPDAVYRPDLCIRTTLQAAQTYNFPEERMIFEITEGEKVEDHAHLREVVQYYEKCGFKTAIDDFGAGYAGLNLLADLQTDIVKLDMALIRNIDRDRVRQAIVRGILQVWGELSTRVIPGHRGGR